MRHYRYRSALNSALAPLHARSLIPTRSNCHHEYHGEQHLLRRTNISILCFMVNLHGIHVPTPYKHKNTVAGVLTPTGRNQYITQDPPRGDLYNTYLTGSPMTRSFLLL